MSRRPHLPLTKELKAQKNLYIVGTGGQMMAMSFNYYQELNLKIAREIITHVINEYLSTINSNKEVKPYLHEYLFSAKNVKIRIWVYNPDRSELPPEKIYSITSLNGMLKYYARSNPRQAIYEKTYKQALRAISSE